MGIGKTKGTRKRFPFLLATMRGISQVFLIGNWVTGLLILAAITITSFKLGLMAFLSAAIGTLFGRLGGGHPVSVERGLYGYNPMLTGMALFLFLEGPVSWGIALFGAAVSAAFTASVMRFLQPAGMPTLTFPYIVTTWLLMLSSYKFEAFKVTDKLVPQHLSDWKLEIAGEIHWLSAFLDGAGQIFFLQGILAGLLLFLGIFVADWKMGLYAIAGNFIGMFTAYILGGEHTLIDAGLYGYNAILTALAVGVVFRDGANRLSLYSTMISCVLTVVFIGSVDTILLPFGLPALTMPFALSTSIFIGARLMMR
ncbi:urea transporter [Sporosarcina highlanderae]|uniref:Urea transporter n=1 Tax=Sporosarcina highlanderae TaxID=3035916 RepID=A0ABT8JV55_9BACL|nr:urea transporter [Sporosarcina highlanderae]MDN4608431.1 urea transporter [Sporosarcina highlanderae]